MPKAKPKTRSKRQAKSPYSKEDGKPKQKAVPKTVKKSANLTWFLKVYKGLDDWHLPIFEAVRDFTRAKRVLYPGCDKHLTASLVFKNVVYVDLNKKLEPVFKDRIVLDWVQEHRQYPETTQITFLCKNFDTAFEEENSFDLMISACAGIVSEPCLKYLKVGGYFLVSDAHFDARTTFLRPDHILIAFYDTETKQLESSPEKLEGHFMTTKGSPITKAEVDESMNKPKNRRSFKLQKEAMFYLFKKIK